MKNLLFKILGRLCPASYVHIYKTKAQKIGLKKIYFLLSLDCDTDDDTNVVEKFVKELIDIKIKPGIAAPGKVILRNTATFQKLAAMGVEIINHGYADHTFFNTGTGRYASKTFYKKMNNNDIQRDIYMAHELISKKLHIEPKGFRTPHFGTFQKKDSIYDLHKFLAELNYKWSSSTVPSYAANKAPLFKNYGVTEIPLSGLGKVPTRLIDSWGFFDQKKRCLSKKILYELNYSKQSFEKIGIGIINLYFDPSHVFNSKEVKVALENFLMISEPTTFEKLISKSE